MRFILILVTILVTFNAQAKEDWFCTQETSRFNNDDSIDVCGIAKGRDEAHAQSEAFYQAERQFKQICASSDTCGKRSVSTLPKRTSCEEMTMKELMGNAYGWNDDFYINWDGVGPKESAKREKAFNAKKAAKDKEPSGWFKCYRMVQFTLN